MITQEKINKSINLLKKAERLALKYSSEGFYLAFSGGKDSQCIYHLAKLAGVRFKAFYNVTTIDPPELMRFIRKNYSDVIWNRNELTFYNLIRKKKMLPTQTTRYCCQYLKERGGEGQVVITGVRRAESVKSSKRNSIEISSHKFSGNFDEFNAVYHTNDEGLEHRCISGKDKIIINPIIDWNDNDVWSFIKEYLKIEYCELYDKGWRRIGCLLCPMCRKSEQRKYLKEYPNIKNGILSVIKDLKKEWKKKGYKNFESLSEQEILEWWIIKKNIRSYIADKKQLKLDL